jgi:hypothetical protein
MSRYDLSSADWLVFFKVLEASFDIHEGKIISFIAYDVLELIPWLSRAGLMETRLRILLSTVNMVSSHKASLVLERIRSKGVFGFLKFLSILHKNRSHNLHRRLEEILLQTAEELHTSGNTICRDNDILMRRALFPRVLCHIRSIELEMTLGQVPTPESITSRRPFHSEVEPVDQENKKFECSVRTFSQSCSGQAECMDIKVPFAHVAESASLQMFNRQDDPLCLYGVDTYSVSTMVKQFQESNGALERKNGAC